MASLMPATVSEIRAAIKAALDQIGGGLHVYATEPANPTLPAAWPMPLRGTFGQVLADDAKNTYQFRVWILVSMGADVNRSQTAIDPYLSAAGSRSIAAALEADDTLGGVVDSVNATGWSQYGTAQSGDATALAAAVDCEIFG